MPLALALPLPLPMLSPSNFPQLLPPELRIGTIMGLALKLPQSNSETGEGQIQGPSCHLPSKGWLSGPLVHLLPFQCSGCRMGGAEIVGEWVAVEGQELVLGSLGI